MDSHFSSSERFSAKKLATLRRRYYRAQMFEWGIWTKRRDVLAAPCCKGWHFDHPNDPPCAPVAWRRVLDKATAQLHRARGRYHRYLALQTGESS
jgi:hypothetical protein